MSHPLQAVLAQLNQIILGKETVVQLAVAGLLARGHLLLEDLPGVGKTTLAHAVATTLGLRFSRVQFTSDLLPADLLGVSLYERDSGRFRFHHGPVFTQVLLADEINRAPPKTQSALLEAMEEHQVSIDGETYALPEPFFVIATQNPQHQIGTFPLPESQLDRFLMRLELGYPGHEAERAMLSGEGRRELVARLTPACDADTLAASQRAAAAVKVAAPLLDYIQALAAATRHQQRFACGLSPRALIGLVAATRAWAWLDGRDHAIPEDVQAVFPAIAGHRLLSRASGRPDPLAAAELLGNVAIP
ncbi:MoxR family ATPase [Jeongeupia sp. USM3]|uniref:AAA family ATPase n=1 Tax=Jeongeupia sp. USM3 TaxID=1906741 RepID=UPI00089E0465|nr:AAA family ATPase [Jeongeupia sp. USM3]AOX99032.1 AAA family ATPase [Jeongeupia sp. USM3]